mgnify:CR=1 FL=1
MVFSDCPEGGWGWCVIKLMIGYIRKIGPADDGLYKKNWDCEQFLFSKKYICFRFYENSVNFWNLCWLVIWEKYCDMLIKIIWERQECCQTKWVLLCVLGHISPVKCSHLYHKFQKITTLSFSKQYFCFAEMKIRIFPKCLRIQN